MREGDSLGRYRLDARLGAGGMGTVYRGYDEQLQRTVAIKVLSAASGTDAAEANARLLREARAAAMLNHPNAVAVYDVGEADGAPFVVMELIAGKPLRVLMAEAILWQRRLEWLVQAARALHAAHAVGLVHRDVKPENVMVREDGQVKVVDFGIARRTQVVDPNAPTSDVNLQTLTVRGQLIGTPMYMASEQLLGEELDGRADQFAWGVMAYEVFCGQLPWGPVQDMVRLVSVILRGAFTPLQQCCPELPVVVCQVIDRTLARDRSARFASMQEVLDALAEGLEPGRTMAAGLAVQGPTTTGGAEVASLARSGSFRAARSWWLAGAIAAAVSLGVVGLGVLALLMRSPPAPPSVSAQAPIPSESVTTLTPAVYPCARRDAGASSTCSGGAREWCDEQHRVVACCAEGLAATGEEGLCGCPPGGVGEQWDGGGCRRAAMNLQEYGKLVQGAVRENYPQIRACYQQALVDAAELAGRVSVFFEVAPDGRIFSARITQASLPDPGTQACYRRVIRSLKLPPPPGGAASIEYPIVLTPD